MKFMTPIPFLSVSGSHYECGRQVGEAFKKQITHYLDLCKKDPPKALTWDQCVAETPNFVEPTEKYFPEVVEEIRGVSAGSGIDFDTLFALTIEEFYSSSFSVKACTDIVVLPPVGNHTIVVHNNDLPREYRNSLTTIEWNFDDGSRMYSVGLGFMVSCGVNNSSVVLSGNEVSPTDTRTSGIPRALIARAILLARNFDDAVKIATNSERASSYNNIITTPNQSISIEGSATDHDYLFPSHGFLAHSNHYCSSKMLPFEGKPNNISSIERLRSAKQIVSEINQPIDLKAAEKLLTNHKDSPIGSDTTICRHSDIYDTLFGFAVDLDECIVELASGHPCENQFKKVWRIK